MNTFSNAIDAIDETNAKRAEQSALGADYHLEISTKLVDSHWAEITIADNGPGIPEAVQRKIYEPFFTTKPVGQGTGMGLSISYQIIVERHGGQLICSSRLGEGTTFTIKIPITQSQELLPQLPDIQSEEQELVLAVDG